MKKIFYLLAFILMLTISGSCKKPDSAKAASVSTAPVTNITATSATSGGDVTSDGGAEISARGVCWGTSANPSVSDSKTSDGDGTGEFISEMTGLSSGSTYHVRAYATNSEGTAYGEDLTFSTQGQVPTVATQAATNISSTGATLNGTVNANDLTTTVNFEYGITTSYGHTATPVLDQVDGNYEVAEYAVITGLTPNTAYHFRIRAVNSAGTVYGADMTFTTSVLTQVTDGDGNIYGTVTIGSQVWLDDNLKTTRYSDGTAIPDVTDNAAWSTTSTGAYCDYANNPAKSDIYGRLYNFYAVANAKNVCPTGWHIPTDADWTALAAALGGESVAGGKLKETGTTHWLAPNTGATNETGFTALPGGYRSQAGSFGLEGSYGFYWTATEGGTTFAFYRYMFNTSASLASGDNDKHGGFYIRCIKN